MMSAGRVIEDETTPTLVFQKIAVPATTFGHQYATQRVREFLAEDSHLRMIRLTLVPDEKPATYSRLGRDHCDPYWFWRMQWDAISAVTFPVAELMSIEGNAILRYRDRNGTAVLQGSDPRQIRVGNFIGKIIQAGMYGRIESPLPRLYAVDVGIVVSKDGALYA